MSGDVLFDETFSSAIARTWQQFHDGLALIPKTSFIPSVDTIVGQTGFIVDNFQQVEEGEFEEGADDCPDLITHSDGDDEDSMPCLSHGSSHSSDEEDEADANQFTWEADGDDDDDYSEEPLVEFASVGPQVVDNSANGSQRPRRETRAPQRLMMDHREAAKK